MPILKLIQAVMTVASVAYQTSQANKMKRAQEKRKGSVFAVKNDAISLPIIYGKQRVAGVQYDHKVSSDYFASSNTTGVVTFNNTMNNTSNIDGSKNEFLYCYQAFAQGGINAIKHVEVNGKAFNHEDYKHGLIARIHPAGGVDTMMTANGYSSTNKFSGVSYAALVFRLDRDENNYGGAPDVSFYVEGRKVYTITPDFELNTSKVYSNNPAYVLLDYLLDPISGRGLSVDEIDLMSFKHAADICNITVMSGQDVAGHVNNMLPISNYPSLATFPDANDKGLSDTLFKDNATGLYYYWNKTGGSDEEPTGNYVLTTVQKRTIPLYECNLSIDTTQNIRDNIESILDTMSYAELTWSERGQYRLHLDYPANQEGLESLVDASHHFTADDILRDGFNISFPTATDRFNQATITFENEHEDFDTDSATWPTTGSAAHNLYLTEDNQQPLRFEGSVEGLTDPYHAMARAEQLVRSSRSIMTVSFTASRKALTVEPGDMIKITLPQSGIVGDVFRVQEVKVLEDLSVEITAYFFDVNALAWNVSDTIAYKDKPKYTYRIGAPTNVVITPKISIGGDGTAYSSIQVTWDDISQANVVGYELQWKLSTDTNYTNSSTTRTTEYSILNTTPNTSYDIRVRGYSALGTYGVWSGVGNVTAIKDTSPPSSPTSIVGTGFPKGIQLSWVNPPELDFSHVEVYESGTTSSASSIKIAEIAGSDYARNNLGWGVTRYYWLKAVDNSGNKSAFSSMATASSAWIDDPAFEDGIYSLFTDQGLYAIRDVTSLPTVGAFVGEKIFNRADGLLYEWDGSTWNGLGVTNFSELEGLLQTNQIALDAITNDLLANDAVQAENVANLAITEGKVAANAITTSKISDLAISAGKIADGAATEAKIATNAITGTKISDGAISTPKILAGAITAGTIGANAVTAGKINAGAVTAGTIAAGAVTAGTIAANAVTANEIAADSITSAKISAGAVTATEIAANAIIAGKIAANAVTANTIAADSITSAKIAAGAVTATEIAANTITGNKIFANTITGGLLATSGIITSSAQIGNALITNAKIGNLAVSTLKIQDQAVTFPTAAQYVGIKYTTLNASTFNTLVTHTHNRTAGVLANIQASGMMGHCESNYTVNSSRNVLYNAVLTVQPPGQPEAILFAFTNLRVMNFNNIGLLMPILSTAAYTGTYTYRFKVQYASGSAYYLVTGTPTITVTELKK